MPVNYCLPLECKLNLISRNLARCMLQRFNTVIVVFSGRNGKFAAAKFAPFRNLPQILLFFMKNLSFHHFYTEVVFFLSDKVPKISVVPFFHFPIIVLKLPVCLILKAAQSVFKLLLLPAITLHLNQVLSTFSFTCVTIYAACCFVIYNLFSLPVFFSLLLDS